MLHLAHTMAAKVTGLHLRDATILCADPHQPVECTALFNEAQQKESPFNLKAAHALLFPDCSVLAFYTDQPRVEARPYAPGWTEVFCTTQSQRRLAAAHCGND